MITYLVKFIKVIYFEFIYSKKVLDGVVGEALTKTALQMLFKDTSSLNKRGRERKTLFLIFSMLRQFYLSVWGL